MVSPAPVRTRTVRHGSSAPSSAARPPAAPAPGDTALAGRYRIDPRTTSWEWSPEMFAVLDLPPEGTRPCMEALLQCQHREDRSRTLAAINRAVTTGRPFALETRLVRRDGVMRVVVLTGEPRRGPDGAVTTVDGVCVDVSAGRLAHDDDVVTALQTEVTQLRTAMASRATIEQAKGILMLLTGCTDQVAFELLAHISSHTHRKVREVAQTITASATGHATLPPDIAAILRDACPPSPRTG